MEVYKQQKPHCFHEEDDDYSENGGFDSDSNSDCDSDMDPSYCIEETQRQLSNLSIKKKSVSRICKELHEGFEKEPDRVDEKSLEEVQKIIQAGGIDRLKVDQCKVYLRRNGLRLTGNKETLVLRIKEHQEILNGGGDKKYPVSSFVLNCKGDACTGDIVMFEQNVYETFSIASRSASGPPLGTRIVVGRIVKESYGAAKQQHTFTIEVLWSKGEKPLLPLHPLLIKGRNLYRLKTLRQKWEDEGERQKVLMDKHSRGSLARSARESRIQDKEMRKSLRENKGLKKESNKNQPQLKSNQGIQLQNLCSSVNSGNNAPQPQALFMGSGLITSRTEHSKNYGSYMNGANHHPANKNSETISENRFADRYHNRQPLTSMNNPHPVIPRNGFEGRYQERSGLFNDPKTVTQDYGPYSYRFPGAPKQANHFPVNENTSARWKNGFAERYNGRQPLTGMDDFGSVISINRQGYNQQKQCKFYAQGRCYYGDNCKFSHN